MSLMAKQDGLERKSYIRLDRSINHTRDSTLFAEIYRLLEKRRGYMVYRYDMAGKNPQQQAIVRKREEENRKRKNEDERKRERQQNMSKQEPVSETNYCTIWKRVTLEMDNNDVAAIELINVKKYDRLSNHHFN